ncbi:MAG: acyl-CoA dehydrogenase [Chloroflexia bacterium]|nr:acyl-CoA dehydrogenase [Chloroflexia bacterium]
MDLTLTEEQRMIRDMARDFAQKELAPKAAERDENDEFPRQDLRKMGELGLLGLTVPEAYDGFKVDTVSYCLAMEEIARACAATSLVMTVHCTPAIYPIVYFGSEEQKRRCLPHMASGEWLGAFALTEAGAGSDAASISTTAVREGDEYVLNGVKSWITTGDEARILIVFATVDRSKGHKGITAFIVDSQRPGFRVGKHEEKMGMRASHTTEVILEDYRAPLSDLLGEEGQGFKIALGTLDASRIGIAAQAVGIAQAALDTALRYAQERCQFGQPIAQFQAIQWMLADMATRVEAARLLTWQAALKQDRGERCTKEASMAKLFASEVSTWVCDRALQIHGGYGYSREYPVERYYRDARVTRIYEGTSEIQRLVIATQLLRGS